MSKKFVYLFLFIGSIVGGYVPLFWGGSAFSMSSIILSGVGGLIGFYVGYRLGESLG